MSSTEKVLSQDPRGVILRLYVRPKSHPAAVIGLHHDRLMVAVTHTPDRGKANEAVIRVIAEVLHLARTDVQILRGDFSRHKDVLLACRCFDGLRQILDDIIKGHE